MADTTNYVPEGQNTLMPYLSVRNAPAAIEFYKNVFGATEALRLTEPDGRVGHAEIRIGDSIFMLADEFPEHGIVGPQTLGGSGVSLHLYVPDVDDVAARAVAAGASLPRPVEDQFYGDRAGKLIDPFGHVWMIATPKETMTAEEMQQRYDALPKE